MKNLLFGLFALLILTSCGEKKHEGWVVNGTINGFADCEITLDVNNKKYTAQLVGGKFTMKGDPVSEPAMTGLSTNTDPGLCIPIFIENGIFTFTANVTEKSFEGRNGATFKTYEAKIVSHEGSEVNKQAIEVDKMKKAIMQPIWDTPHGEGHKMSDSEYTVLHRAGEAEVQALFQKYIKDNPNSLYTPFMLGTALKGSSNEDIKKVLGYINPNIKSSIIDIYKEKLATSKDVDISKVIKASNVSYKVDNSYDGTAHKNAKYIGVMKSGNLVALNNDNSISVINDKGKQISTFTTTKEGKVSTIAVDENDNIFVLIPNIVEVETEYRGKKMKSRKIDGYKCDIYTTNGKLARTMNLKGTEEATGARVANNKLILADMRGSDLDVFNAETGVLETSIPGMRACCGILDFSINDKNEVLVANLGAFRVESYNLSGKKLFSFGSRGTAIDLFHGCCNPVSVAYLSNGALVTVEKDPTRVKVYSKEGAIAIKGIDEMVKGCTYIPMTVDGKDNLYLASPIKGIVKCVAS